MKGDFTRFTFDRRKHYSGLRMQQGRVQLDADWNEQVDVQTYHTRTAARDVIGPSGVPRDGAGFALRVDQGQLVLTPGRMYVQGILCENDSLVALAEQPDLPGGASFDSGSGLYLAYLDVWHRSVTSLQDPALREVALGGADTAIRARTVWQARFLRIADIAARRDTWAESSQWQALHAPPSGALRVRLQPGARVRSRLYRVEIHDATRFKWSRDNGSVAVAWTDQEGDHDEKLILDMRDPARARSFAVRQWVELTDDTHELASEPGALVRIASAEGAALIIEPDTATGEVLLAEYPKNPIVRRWDSDGPVTLTSDEWILLEDGIEIAFAPGTYRAGDHWIFATRELTGALDWPVDETGQPVAEPPHGIEHHYAALALVTHDGSSSAIAEDLRRMFPPLADLHGDDDVFRVVDVRLRFTGQTVRNGDLVRLSSFFGHPDSVSEQGGIEVAVAGAEIASATIDRSTLSVTVEEPLAEEDATNASGYVLKSVAADITASFHAERSRTEIALIPRASAREWLNNALDNAATLIPENDRRAVLARVVARGDFISELDRAGLAPSIGPARDFELKFWLIAPRLTVDTELLDFNGVIVGEQKDLACTVSNDSPADTNVAVAVAGAPFSLVSLSEFNVPASGGSVTVTVRFAPGARGQEAGTLTIESTDAAGEPLVVALEGRGLAPEIQVEPESLDFASVHRQGTKRLGLVVRNVGDIDLVITGIATAAPFALIPAPPSSPVAPGAAASVEVEFAPTETGKHGDDLVIQSSNHADVLVSLQGIGVVPTIEVSRTELHFGEVSRGSSHTLQLVVENPLLTSDGHDSVLLQITELDLSPELSAITLDKTPPLLLPPGGQEALRLTFAPDKETLYNGTLTINSTEPDSKGPSVAVTIDGNGTQPLLEEVDSPLSFGDVIVGTAANQILRLKNAGAGRLDITELRIDNPVFYLDPDPAPFTLSSTQELPLTVQFAPAQEGSQSASLTILSGSEELATVDLQGNGIMVAGIVITGPGTTNIFDHAPGHTYNRATAEVFIEQSVNLQGARLTGQGHNQDTVGYARVMRVDINGNTYQVIDWLSRGQTKSFTFNIPDGVLVHGTNEIRSYIHFGNDQYDGGHWTTVDLVIL